VKKTILALILFFLSLLPVHAEKVSEVVLRFSSHAGNVRIVVQSDDDFIRGTNVQISSSTITASFPTRFVLKLQKDFLFRITERERSLIMHLKDAADIRTYKLDAPARLVIDLKTGLKTQGGTSESQNTAGFQPLQGSEQGTGDAGRQTGQRFPEIGPNVSPKSPSDAAMQDGQIGQSLESAAKPRRNVVVIDPGHGGYDYGLTAEGAKEKDMALFLAKDLLNAFSKRGMVVFMTRKADQNSSLADRITLANSKRPELFISIHASSSDKFVLYVAAPDEENIDPAVKQYSQLANQNKYMERSRDMAKSIGRSLRTEFATDVVLRELPLPVLAAMSTPAVLIECPLLDTYSTDRKLRGRFANAVIKGISAYEQ
jgi:N-acetylmuramoyl-L-alanine amidase